jgi:uncharacterized protein YndB with AHSA1/START domain
MKPITHSTFVIERSYPATPQRVFAAFADPGKKRRWFLEAEHQETEEHEMDFRVGGKDHAVVRFKEGTPFPGALLVNNGTYQDIVPDQRLVLAYTMAFGEKRFSASLATIELLPASEGTKLILTHQGAYFEGADGPKMREEGWQTLLEKLAKELARSNG